MASPPNVNNVFSLAQIAAMQLHVLAVWALLLQEQGYPALVPVVFYFIFGNYNTNLLKLCVSKDIIRMQQMLSVFCVFFPVQIAQMQRHVLAVWVLLLQERGRLALVPVVFFFIFGNYNTNLLKLYLSKDIIRMEQMLRVFCVFFPVQIAQIQLHARAVWALLLQERGHPAPVPAVYIYIYLFRKNISK
jgi:hypothetical protein